MSKTKKCRSCLKRKKVGDFYDNPLTQDKKQSICKECDKAHRRAVTQERKLELIRLAGGACQTCGYDVCVGALEFHHPKGSKEASVSTLLRHSFEKAATEARKCLLLCANCHRELHFKPQTRPSGIVARGEREHGTLTMYHYCGPPKCGLCLAAKGAYMREYMRDRRASGTR